MCRSVDFHLSANMERDTMREERRLMEGNFKSGRNGMMALTCDERRWIFSSVLGGCHGVFGVGAVAF